MSLRDTLRKAAELLVEMPPEEREASVARGTALSSGAGGDAADKLWAELEKEAQPSAPTKTVAQIVRDGAGPNLDQIQVPVAQMPTAEGGSVAFPAIYKAADLPEVSYGAEQALEMIGSMPKELPLDTKRQMIKAAMNSMGKALGASPETIVTDASRKLAALAAYTDYQAKLANDYGSTSERKIAELQAEIEEIRYKMQETQAHQQMIAQSCAAESHRLDEVLEFFSLDVPPSKYAPQS